MQPAFVHELVGTNPGVQFSQQQQGAVLAARQQQLPPTAMGVTAPPAPRDGPAQGNPQAYHPNSGFPYSAPPQPHPSHSTLVRPLVAPPSALGEGGGSSHAYMAGTPAQDHFAGMSRGNSAGGASDRSTVASFPFSMVNMKAKSWVGFEEDRSGGVEHGRASQHGSTHAAAGWGRSAQDSMQRQMSADAALVHVPSGAWDDFVIHSGAKAGSAQDTPVEAGRLGLPQTGQGTGTGTGTGSSDEFMSARHDEAHAEAQASIDELLGDSDHADFDISGFVITSGQGHAADRVSSFGQDSFVSAGVDDLSLGRGSAQRGRMERSGTNQSGVSDHADVAHVPGVTQDSAWPVPSGRAYQHSYS